MSRLNHAFHHGYKKSKSLRLSKERAALVVYRMDKRGQPRFLLVSSRRNPDRLTLPGGKIDSDESPRKAAIRETAEESGVLTHRPRELGRYLHRKRKRRYHPTTTYLARYASKLGKREPRDVCWLTLEELQELGFHVRSPIMEQLRLAARALRKRAAA